MLNLYSLVYTSHSLSTNGGIVVHQTALPLLVFSVWAGVRGQPVVSSPPQHNSQKCPCVAAKVRPKIAYPRRLSRDGAPRGLCTLLYAFVAHPLPLWASRAMLSTSARLLLNRSASRSLAVAGTQQVSILHPAAVAGGVRPRQRASTKAAPAVEGLTLNVDERVQRTKHRVPIKR